MGVLKQAYQQTLVDRISGNPFLDLTIPSVLDATLCPKGYHIMNCFMQYTPYHPNCVGKTEGNVEKPISHELIRETFLRTINDYL